MTFAAYYTQFTNAYKLLRSSFTVVPTIPGSRLSLIGQILLPQHVLHSFVHSLMGVLVFWSCTVLSRGPYQSLAVPCNTDPRWVSLEQIIVIIQRLSYAWMCLVLVIFYFFFLHWSVYLCFFYFSDKDGVQKMCLNERYLFLLLTGAFMGYSYSLLYFIHNMNYLSFPIMQVRQGWILKGYTTRCLH